LVDISIDKSHMPSTFRLNTFDPVYTFAQILTLQSAFYLSAGLALWLLDGLVTSRKIPVLQELFDARLFSLGTSKNDNGWCIILSYLIAGAGLGGMLLMFIVRRAKLCVDFTLTLYGIHIFGCSLYAGTPTTLLWWITNGLSATVMILLGEYLCMRKELEPIKLSFNNVDEGEAHELQTLNP
jgi:protein SYS1